MFLGHLWHWKGPQKVHCRSKLSMISQGKMHWEESCYRYFMHDIKFSGNQLNRFLKSWKTATILMPVYKLIYNDLFLHIIPLTSSLSFWSATPAALLGSVGHFFIIVLFISSSCKAEMIFKLYCALLLHPSKTPLFSIRYLPNV